MSIPKFNPESNQMLSKLLFGGDIKYKQRVPVLDIEKNPVLIKSGKNKGAVKHYILEMVHHIEGIGIKPHDAWKGAVKGIYSVDDGVLNTIAKKSNDVGEDIARIMLKIRELDNQINTYYNSTEALVHDFDSCVHTQLCHCGYEKANFSLGGGTNTGRLSCKSPNMQNQPRKSTNKVKQHFCSRYEDGLIIEFDYAAIEVVIFAYLSQDFQLIEDLNNGLDIYLLAVADIYNVDYKTLTKEDDRRQVVKPAILGIIYGEGQNRLSRELNIDKGFAKKIITTFYNRYPMAKVWQDNLVEEVNQTRKLIPGKLTKLGQPVHLGKLQTITGRICYFETTDSPEFLREKGILTSFNPPNIKNYPVQSMATSDIVLIMLGRLFRKSIQHRDKYLLINTVHDSIVIDCRKEFKDFACNFIKTELESVNVMLKEVFNLDFNLSLKVDIKCGKTWYDC